MEEDEEGGIACFSLEEIVVDEAYFLQTAVLAFILYPM
jgi:hypothetical protein